MNNTIFLFIATLFCWSPTWYIIKFQLGVVEPIVSVFYRFFLSSIILLIFCIFKKYKLNFSLKNHFYICLLGVLLFNINYVLFYISTQYLISGWVALCFSSLLLMNILNYFLFYKEKPSSMTIAGSIFGLIGLLIIFNQEIFNFDYKTGKSFGILIGLIATYVASLVNMVSVKNSKDNLNVISVNALAMLYGSLSLFIYLLFSKSTFNFEFTSEYINSLIYLSIFGSVLGFSFYLTLIKNIGPSNGSYVSIVMPVMALIISTYFENLEWTITLILGGFLILMGNLFIVKSSS